MGELDWTCPGSNDAKHRTKTKKSSQKVQVQAQKTQELMAKQPDIYECTFVMDFLSGWVPDTTPTNLAAALRIVPDASPAPRHETPRTDSIAPDATHSTTRAKKTAARPTTAETPSERVKRATAKTTHALTPIPKHTAAASTPSITRQVVEPAPNTKRTLPPQIAFDVALSRIDVDSALCCEQMEELKNYLESNNRTDVLRASKNTAMLAMKAYERQMPGPVPPSAVHSDPNQHTSQVIMGVAELFQRYEARELKKDIFPVLENLLEAPQTQLDMLKFLGWQRLHQLYSFGTQAQDLAQGLNFPVPRAMLSAQTPQSTPLPAASRAVAAASHTPSTSHSTSILDLAHEHRPIQLNGGIPPLANGDTPKKRAPGPDAVTLSAKRPKLSEVTGSTSGPAVAMTAEEWEDLIDEFVPAVQNGHAKASAAASVGPAQPVPGISPSAPTQVASTNGSTPETAPQVSSQSERNVPSANGQSRPAPSANHTPSASVSAPTLPTDNRMAVDEPATSQVQPQTAPPSRNASATSISSATQAAASASSSAMDISNSVESVPVAAAPRTSQTREPRQVAVAAATPTTAPPSATTVQTTSEHVAEPAVTQPIETATVAKKTRAWLGRPKTSSTTSTPATLSTSSSSVTPSPFDTILTEATKRTDAASALSSSAPVAKPTASAQTAEPAPSLQSSDSTHVTLTSAETETSTSQLTASTDSAASATSRSRKIILKRTTPQQLAAATAAADNQATSTPATPVAAPTQNTTSASQETGANVSASHESASAMDVSPTQAETPLDTSTSELAVTPNTSVEGTPTKEARPTCLYSESELDVLRNTNLTHPTSNRGFLVTYDDSKAIVQYRITAATTTIGRSADISIGHVGSRLSRKQAQIIMMQDKKNTSFAIQSIGSCEMTINGKPLRLDISKSLQDGDVLTVISKKEPILTLVFRIGKK